MNLMNRFSPKNESIKIHHNDPDLNKALSNKVVSWLPTIPREYVLVCIGTDRSTGDALGPLVGTFFSEMKPKHLTVYGTLNHPVHATNLTDNLKKITKQHRHPFIIAIDACLGKTSSVGCLIASQGPLKPGAALNKSLPPVGDIHVTGVVNVSGFMEYSVLQNTRLSVVVEMAKKIASIMDVIDQRLTYHQSSPAIVIRQLKESL